MSYKVRIESFEGPFDLLVYLIENAQMSIYDIQIAEITNQYIEYVDEMKNVDFNMATEFMVLAATLIDIKSKMILPRGVLEGHTEFEEDPRSELVERLLEYKRYKKYAELMKEREEYGAGFYEKPQEDISHYLENPDVYLDLDAEEFAEAFKNFLFKKKREEEVRKNYTRIERERATIESRIGFIKTTFRNALRGGVKRLSLRALIPNKSSRYDVVVTFVTVLQMVRDRFLDVEQGTNYGEITVSQGEKNFEEVSVEQ